MIQVYCHTNLANGKKYVGVTSCGAMNRWGEHIYSALRRTNDDRCGGRCSAFHGAIRKYGPDAFQHEVLEELMCVEDANVAEERWIASLGTLVPHGYNIRPGGRFSPNSDSTKEKMSIAAKKRFAGMTAEQRSKHMAAAHRALTKEDRTKNARLGHTAWWGSMTVDQRRHWMREMASRKTSQEHSDRVRRANSSRSPELRSRIARQASEKFRQDPKRAAAAHAKAVASRKTNARPVHHICSRCRQHGHNRRTCTRQERS